MKKLAVIFLLILAPYISHAAIDLSGSWTTAKVNCKTSGDVPVKVKPILESLIMTFNESAVSQILTFMPNCTVSSTGSYQVEGSFIQFGLLKSTLSQGCPSGMSVKDKDPVKNQFRIDNNFLVLESSAGIFCAQPNDTLEMYLKKNSRISPFFK